MRVVAVSCPFRSIRTTGKALAIASRISAARDSARAPSSRRLSARPRTPPHCQQRSAAQVPVRGARWTVPQS